MTFSRITLAALPLLALAACSGGGDGDAASQPVAPADADPAAGTRPAGQPDLALYEGRIEQGVECLLLATPDGERWAFNPGEADFGVGDYVAIEAGIADASFCQEGQGTLVPQTITAKQPPARDRDPARAGGVALTEDYLRGRWVAKRAAADCDDPDFVVERRSGGLLLLAARVNGGARTGKVVLDGYPRIDFPDPLPDLPIESRGPDGVALLRPATDAAYDPVSIGSARIAGDGVVFVKCA